MIHTLKIQDEYLKNLLEGKKRCEIRFNDRDYQVGDILEFHDLHGIAGVEAYGKFTFEVLHIHSGLGLKEGFVILSVVQKFKEDAS